MQLNHRRHLFIGCLLLFTLAINAGVAFFNIRRLDVNGRAVAQIYLITGRLDDVLSESKDIRTAENSFIASGDELALEPYRSSEQQLSESLISLRESGAAGAQKSDFPNLKLAIERRLTLARKAIQTRRDLGLIAARKIVNSKESENISKKIEYYIDSIQSHEQDVLQQRAEESSQSAQDAMRTFWITSGANVWLVIFVSRLLWRAAKQNAVMEEAFADLKKAESMRDGLSAMLVHDLRTPLTTLLGPLLMLEDGTFGQLDESQREIVAMSHNSGERLLDLINELLDVSKLDAGEMRLEREEVSVDFLIQKAIGELVRLENVDSPRIESNIQPHCQVNGDRNLLVRVLINLLGNALKFTSMGGKIIISARQNNEGTTFSVKDSGEGIPVEDLTKIFDKFGQVESRKAGRKLSTGLGLTFCKLAVEAHGGQIWVESEVGKGSTFQFVIPAEKTPDS